MQEAINELSRMCVMYPQLEGRIRYTYKELPWHDPERIRYENYACLVHNFLLDCLAVQRSLFFGRKYQDFSEDTPGLRELAVLHYEFLDSREHAPFVSQGVRRLLDSVKDEYLDRKRAEHQ